MNKKTASAAEDIVGRLKDSKAALIIGERTAGAGCGFTNGGINLKLKNSGLIVKIPDCARYLRDGTNEVEGISPDIEIDMSRMKSFEFISQLRTIFTATALKPDEQLIK